MKIAKKVSKWVVSQKEVAETLGVSAPSIHSMLAGKKQLPLNRFLQIVYNLNPPQNEVDEVFNLYLAKFEIPANAMLIRKKEKVADYPADNSDDHSVLSSVIDAVMGADIDDAAKVKVYNIIKNIRDK